MNTRVKPLSPSDAEKNRLSNIPDGVIECFNEVIQANIDMRGYARVEQNEVVCKIASRMHVSRQTVFNKGWLDVEPIYREAGWKVSYDKPAYCESYEAYYEFWSKK